MKKGTDKYCWKTIGIRGRRSCPELLKHVHCRNCPRYESAGRNLLDREPPKNYIEELTEIIARPEIKKDGRQKTVMVFRLGSELLALPVSLFIELTRPCPIRRVPHRSNSVFLGLVGIQGDIQMCFSMGSVLGVQSAEVDKTTPAAGIRRRFCIVGKHNRRWVFPVDEVCGLGNYAEKEVQPVPVNAAKTMQKYTVGIIAVNKRQTGLINDDLVFAAFERSFS